MRENIRLLTFSKNEVLYGGMLPKILVCGTTLSDSEPIVQALRNLGYEANATTFEEVKGEHLIAPETTVMAIKTPDSFVLSIGVRRPRVDSFARRVAHALLGATICHPMGLEFKIPEPPPELRIDNIVKTIDSLDDAYLFERPKPQWPRTKHMRPTAVWRYRPATAHPARSRARMW